MKKLIRDNKTYAVLLSAEDFQPGAKFVSEPEWRLQVGLLTLPPGHAIAAHSHLPKDACPLESTQEFLLVVRGKMEVDFFDEMGRSFHTETMREGDALLHIRGGHAFRFFEETRLIEVKSGPYRGRENDKVLLGQLPVRSGREPDAAQAPEFAPVCTREEE
jgi:mannose-6-phosphate isomerase-like protein (cupin superfamily)